MKKRMAAIVMLAMMIPALALASGPVLQVGLPQDAQRIENVVFDDGDFIRTYQLSGGANVRLLRYQAFDMTIEDLVTSEWVGCTDVRGLELGEIGGYPASGVRLSYQEEGSDALNVTIILVNAGDATLVYEAVYPSALGDAQIEASVQQMISTMDVTEGELPEEDETAVVG